MSVLPPQVKAALEEMIQHIYSEVLDRIRAEIPRMFGQAWRNGKIDGSFGVTLASTTKTGVVKVDGDSVLVDGTGLISAWVEEVPALTALPDPTTAPTLSVVAGTSTLTAGTYTLATCWMGANGSQTLLSPATSITVTAGQVIQVVAGDSMPSGATGMAVYAITTTTAVAGYTPALYG